MKKSSVMNRFIIVVFTVFSLMVSGCSASNQKSDDQNTQNQSDTTGAEDYDFYKVFPENGIIKAPDLGVIITLPESFLKYEDSICLSGLTTSEFCFARLEILVDGKEKGTDFLQMLAYRNETDPETLANEEIGTSKDMIKYLGTNSTLYYYGYSFNDIKNANPDFFEERVLSDIPDPDKAAYQELLSDTDEIFEGIEFTEVKLPEPIANTFDGRKLLELKGQDLEGNEVRLSDLIENNKITVLNFWGTFCGACVMEMPDLQYVSEKYQDQDVAIVGIVVDVLDDDNSVKPDIFEKEMDILEVTGVKYVNLHGTKEIQDFTNISCFPTTYIVGADGHLLREPVLGNRRKEEWIEFIEQYL